MNILQRLKTTPWLPEGITLLGVLLFAAQTWNNIHAQMSIDDEGNYLLKGILFVRGQYKIFQDYGPWSNHMPLSFLIPGAVLDWFGTSLRTARLFAFLLGLLMLLGIWIIARRWGGGWWGAFAVWSMALNPAVLKVYSMMTSQVIIACMLAWVLVFVLASKRALWQILAGSALAGTMLLTRLNLAPLLPLLVLYIFWQHGKRPAIWSTIMILIVSILGHAAFWPGILRMWATWIPSNLAPFLQAYRAPEGIPFWNPQVDLEGRLLSLLWGLRYHFVATIGVLATLLLWPRKSAWVSESHRKAGIFLTALFVLMFFLHGYVTVGSGIATNRAYSTGYCIFCFPAYMAFFSFTGILLIGITASSWRRELPLWLQGLISILVVGITTGIGYASVGTFGDVMATWQFPAFTHRWLRHNTLRVWKYINYYYGTPYAKIREMLPIITGFLVGLANLLISLGLTIWNKFLKRDRSTSFGYYAMVVLLVTGWFLSPTLILGGGDQSNECQGDVLATYDQLGQELQRLIPKGATIYWQGEPSAVPLIYLDEVHIFPAQLNQKFTFFTGETGPLERYGFWNQALAEEWLREADFAIVGTLYYNDVPEGELGEEIEETHFYNPDWLVEGLSPDNQMGYRELDQAILPMPCQPGQFIRIFQNQP